MDEKIIIIFPNEGEYNIQSSVIKEWNVKPLDTIGDTIFCESVGSAFSMKVNDYNKIFK